MNAIARKYLHSQSDRRSTIESLLLDTDDRDSICSFGRQVDRDYPGLNVVINNAGISKVEDLKSPPDYLADAEEIEACSDPRTANSHRTQ